MCSCAASTRAHHCGGFHLLEATTCGWCKLRISGILRLFGGVACLFVVWVVVPAKGICFWISFSTTQCCRSTYCPLSGCQIRVDLTTAHNWEALENILAPLGSDSANHRLHHISGAFAHRWAVLSPRNTWSWLTQFINSHRAHGVHISV